MPHHDPLCIAILGLATQFKCPIACFDLPCSLCHSAPLCFLVFLMIVEEPDACHLFLSQWTCSYIARTEHVVSCICGSVLLAIFIPIGSIVGIEVLALVLRFLAEYAELFWLKYTAVATAESVLQWLEKPKWYPSTTPRISWVKNFFLGAENNHQ